MQITRNTEIRRIYVNRVYVLTKLGPFLLRHKIVLLAYSNRKVETQLSLVQNYTWGIIETYSL